MNSTKCRDRRRSPPKAGMLACRMLPGFSITVCQDDWANVNKMRGKCRKLKARFSDHAWVLVSIDGKDTVHLKRQASLPDFEARGGLVA